MECKEVRDQFLENLYFPHTFSVILQYQNYRKCMEKLRIENSRNVVVVEEGNNRNVVVEKQKLTVGSVWGPCRVDVRSMWSWINIKNKK